jgi:chemotaxis protein methyltransferase CheR
MEPLTGKGTFDFVFVRNVLIYFDGPSREQVLKNCYSVMNPGAPLLVGESESLMGTKHPFQYLKPSIFVKAAATTAAPANGAAATGGKRPTPAKA